MAKANMPHAYFAIFSLIRAEELPALYRSADLFVTMSLSETFGLTSLEAANISRLVRHLTDIAFLGFEFDINLT